MKAFGVASIEESYLQHHTAKARQGLHNITTPRVGGLQFNRISVPMASNKACQACYYTAAYVCD